MAKTRTLQNYSLETAESVSIRPFDRDGWTIVDTDARPGAISTCESRKTGDDPEYPLVKRVEVRPANVYHPGHESESVKGRRFSITVYSPVEVVDDVSGVVEKIAMQFEIAIVHAGPTMLVPDYCTNFLLSVASEMYDSVNSGVIDSTVANKIALGATDF